MERSMEKPYRKNSPFQLFFLKLSASKTVEKRSFCCLRYWSVIIYYGKPTH
jgi:hypothetical protein